MKPAWSDYEREYREYYGIDTERKYVCPECGCAQEYVKDGNCCRCGWIIEEYLK